MDAEVRFEGVGAVVEPCVDDLWSFQNVNECSYRPILTFSTGDRWNGI